MKGFRGNIEKDTLENKKFRKVLSKLRASIPDANACINALQSFISKADSLSK